MDLYASEKIGKTTQSTRGRYGVSHQCELLNTAKPPSHFPNYGIEFLVCISQLKGWTFVHLEPNYASKPSAQIKTPELRMQIRMYLASLCHSFAKASKWDEKGPCG